MAMDLDEFKRHAMTVLEAHVGGKVSLNRTTVRLEQLLDQAEGMDDRLHDQLFQNWLVLEEVNAVRADRGEASGPKEEEELVRSAIDRIQALIASISSDQ